MLAVIDDDPTGAHDEADVPVVVSLSEPLLRRVAGAQAYALQRDASVIRRLDYVALAVADTERALSRFCGRLGLSVVSAEVLARPHVRLTYLDAGNAYIQLVVNFASGRGRASAFVPGLPPFRSADRCTEFKFEEDVDGNRGWLDD